MIDLTRDCGLPVWLDDVNHRFVLDDSLLGDKPEQRHLEEVRHVLYENTVQEPKRLYTLFNDVGLPEVRKFLSARGLSYGMGFMPPLKLGVEYIKTMGHYHSLCPGTTVRYPEVYEIVYGAATYLLQKQDPADMAIVEDIILVEGKRGDRLVMPPDYAHVSINTGPEPLVGAHWAAAKCGLEYSEIAQMGGFGYFVVEENGSPNFVRNPRYKQVPPIRKVSLKRLADFDIDPAQPIYSTARNDAGAFRFVVEPYDFQGLFDKLIPKRT